ncbi:hypothetical protein CDL15_Pgr015476 [Punica granatum]|uniref:Uncharacterized protein n=1 Tax=Punica granatum TaxID=22663 RepID=A0A218W162_PUNGR|nr:hypothetical protein CDL15_Pgr015476 [Punica granatum]
MYSPQGADPRVLTACSSSMAPSSSSLTQPLSTSPPSYSFQQNFTMGLTEYGTTNILYEDHPQSTSTASWRPNNQDMSASFQFSQSNIDNKQFVNPNLEGSWERRSKTRLISDPFGSSSQNSSESSDNNQEVDLELRLSL